MFFRNLTIFTFPPSLRDALEALPDQLEQHALKPLGSMEMSTHGFVSPLGQGHSALSLSVGNCLLVTLGSETKVLPAAVVNRAVSEKLDAIQEKENRTPGSKERKRIKDEVIADLLPRAFARPSRTAAYLDLGRGWLVVDTASRKNAEAMVRVRCAGPSDPARQHHGCPHLP